ncbi:MAG: MFS transporter, partial [Anaerolineae bacterium]|nr:MFS transporter [Anaerolineae bacterium]
GAQGRWPIAVLLLVQLLNGMVISAQRYFFPIYVSEALGLTAVLASSFVSLAQVAGIVAAVVGGGLIDTLGRKWTLVVGLAGFVLSSLVYFARAPWLVGGLWAVSGLAMTLASLGAQSYLIRAAGPQSIGVVSAFYHWGFTLGGAFGSPVAGQILDAQGYSVFARLLTSLAALNALLALGLMPRLNRARVRQAGVSWRVTLAGYLEIARHRRMMRLGLMRFLPTCYYGMSLVLIPLLIYAAQGTKTSVALFATTSQIIATVAQLGTGRAADRWGARMPTLIAMSVVSVAAIGQAVFARQAWGLFAFGCLGVAAAWSLSTLMPVIVSGSVPSETQGRALGALDLLWNLAMTLSVLVGGALVEIGTGLPFALAAVLSLGGVVVVVSFFGSRS